MATILSDLICDVFFFSSRRRHTRFSRDWSSDVCSSDLLARQLAPAVVDQALRALLKHTGVKHQGDEIGSGAGQVNVRAVGLEDAAKEVVHRSEERRVGKECRSRWAPLP